MSAPAARSSFRHSVVAKILFIALLLLILLAPLSMVSGLIGEREARQGEAAREVGQSWGTQQQVVGPVVTIPYLHHWSDDGKVRSTRYLAYFLPDDFAADGRIEPEVRSRGIFDVVVYLLHLHLSGTFSRPDFAAWRIADDDVLWDEAVLSVGISDTRGIREALSLGWDGAPLELQAGPGFKGPLDGGLHVALPRPGAGTHRFDLAVSLNGSDTLQLAPVGKVSRVTLASPWPHPSFYGAFLPVERELGAQGFTARWEISHLGRSTPQRWTAQEGEYDLRSGLFGVQLMMPVDFYTKSERSVKYGALFIVLTFTVFFLFEAMSALRVHPLQYLLVGVALILFYLLLLSFSEQIGFALAYLAAAAATIGLVTLYSIKVLRSRRRAALLGLALSALYLFLYFLLHLEDYALLLGSLGLFLTVATVMYVTRDVDWYAVSFQREEEKGNG